MLIRNSYLRSSKELDGILSGQSGLPIPKFKSIRFDEEAYDISYATNVIFESEVSNDVISGHFILDEANLAALLIPTNTLEFNCHDQDGISGFPKLAVLSFNQMLIGLPKDDNARRSIIPSRYAATKNDFKISRMYSRVRMHAKYKITVCIRKRACNEIIAQNMLKHRFYSADKVLERRLKLKNDQDIEIGSEIVSLRDPVTMGRIKLPCRGMDCMHTGCFDLHVYLQTSNFTKKIQCNICSMLISVEDLYIDGYFQSILDNCIDDCDSVEVQPNGEWKMIVESKTTMDSDDDLDLPIADIPPPSSVLKRKRKLDVICIDISDSDDTIIDLTHTSPARHQHPTLINLDSQTMVPRERGLTDEELLSSIADNAFSPQVLEAVEDQELLSGIADNAFSSKVLEAVEEQELLSSIADNEFSSQVLEAVEEQEMLSDLADHECALEILEAVEEQELMRDIPDESFSTSIPRLGVN